MYVLYPPYGLWPAPLRRIAIARGASLKCGTDTLQALEPRQLIFRRRPGAGDWITRKKLDPHPRNLGPIPQCRYGGFCNSETSHLMPQHIDNRQVRRTHSRKTQKLVWLVRASYEDM